MENKVEAILLKDQFGFRKNVVTREAILALRTIIEKRIRKNKPSDVAMGVIKGFTPPPLGLKKGSCYLPIHVFMIYD